MILGIVGAEQEKFTPESEARARELIRTYLRTGKYAGTTSGGCHLGGADIYCEEVSAEFNLPCRVYKPTVQAWAPTTGEIGYKMRNELIAQLADEVICITVAKFPATYKGPRFAYCYHCKTSDHVKSGGCWTVKYALRIGKRGLVITV